MNDKVVTVPRVALVTGYEVSRIVKGGWQLASGHGTVDRKQEQAIFDMRSFVQAGINTFDCADIYTGVEELIGLFLRSSDMAMTMPKIHTKFVPDLEKLPNISKSYVEKIIDRSLTRLGVESLDLVQFHWWDYDIPGYIDALRYLTELQQRKKIHHLGVTNFDTVHLREILGSGVKIISNQIQYSLLDRRPENGMLKLSQTSGISLICYGVLAGGFLSGKYLGMPEPKEPFRNRSLVKYKLIIDECGGWDYLQTLLRTLSVIAEKHHVSICNVAIRYVLDKPGVRAVIVGARDSTYLEDILRIFTFSLDIDDERMIQKVVAQATGLRGDVYFLERIRGGKHASIMKYNLNRQ